MAPPKFRHGRVAMVYLWTFLHEHELGAGVTESGFALRRDPAVLVGQDVAFIRSDRVPIDEDSYPDLAPDLVVDVLSPSNAPAPVEDELAEYAATGVPLAWVPDPKRRTARVRRADGTTVVLTEADELEGGEVRPGFRLRVARLFASAVVRGCQA